MIQLQSAEAQLNSAFGGHDPALLAFSGGNPIIRFTL